MIGIFFYSRPGQRIYFLRSSDRGQNWFQSTIAADATDFAVATNNSTIYLVYKEFGALPTPYVGFMRSTDFGLTWQPEQKLTAVLPVIGKLNITNKDSTVFVEWEGGNKIFFRDSDNGGGSWGRTDSLRAEFYYLPTARYLTHLAETTLFNFWIARGDTNTDYQLSDKNKYQPDHGTHMMSVAGGYKWGTFVGVAPSAQFYMAKTENADSSYEFPIEEDMYIAGLEWLEEKGVDVVNSSLGYSRWYSIEDMNGKTAPISIAAAAAGRRGMLIVTAAGNQDTLFPTRYLVAPGDADSIITVGGIDTLFGRWKGGGFGPTSDGRRKPELVCLSKNVAIAYGDSNEYRYSSGTSNATAIVTGICALLLEGHPNWTSDSVKNALFKTASLASSPNDTMGYGWPDAEKAFFISPVLKDTTSWSQLLPPYPNPFLTKQGNPLVYIPFKINRLSTVDLKIFTMSGRLVHDTTRSRLLPGTYSSKDLNSKYAAFTWDGKDQKGKELGSGLYYVFFLAHPGKDVKKIAIVR